MEPKQIISKLFIPVLTLMLALLAGNAQAQTTSVRGRVTDAAGAALPSVSVFFPGTPDGTSTDENGNYELRTEQKVSKLQFSFISYKTVVKNVSQGEAQTINVQMADDTRTLSEVVVKPKKVRYRNKDNPAVELIRLVVDNKSKNRLESYQYAQYEQYEKVKLSWSNTPERIKKNLLFRRYKYMTSNVDTTTVPGKALMPVYLQEIVSDVYYRKDPEKKKSYITAEKRVDFGSFVDNQGFAMYVKHMYQDIDIYENNIFLVTNQFLSPIADLAPTFYKYYITDTVKNGDERWVELSFFPRNKADMLFQGKLYVTLDGSYAVPRAELTINKNINLNWVRDMDILLDFEKGEDGKYHLAKSTMRADFSSSNGAKNSIYGQRSVSFKKFIVNQPQPDSVYKGLAEEKLAIADTKTGDFWEANRHDSLTATEAQAYVAIDSLQKSKSFRRSMDLITLVLAGYKRVGPYVEIGPVNTFYSFNPVEGFRGRIGGRTTPQLSKRIYFETYGAYGFKDEKWKYYFGGTYSFTGRSIFEFPVTTLRVNYQHDTKIPGQELQFIQEDNFLLSFKRGVNDKWLYNDILNIEFLKEFRSHLSLKFNFKNWKQEPAGGLEYISAEVNKPERIPDITTTELGGEIRWAPKEEFYQGKQYRIPIFNKYPILTFRAIVGVKDLFGGQYNYQNLTLNAYKHYYLSQLGYGDATLEGGYIFGRVPYPLLDIHRANQSYSYQLQSYNMMNFLEFVSDHYVSFNLDHCFNGFFFNKIPLLKKLKFRECVDLKVLYGGVRDENMPDKNPDLLKFPTSLNGKPSTFTLAEQPYVEGSVGIGNILNFFRIDVVKRFTYLDNPNVSSIGIRGRFKFDF